ncbi:MAG TPA: OmpA family protein [Chloroflexota bacterium]|jgi:outer membrane protein OmpA-like peptidoglycan-associated protein|nr:OmpA family protein [Chloroflexota bacterium]
MYRSVAVSVMVLVAIPGPWPTRAQDIKDYPLISRYPGSEFIRPPSVKQFDEIALPVGPWVKGKFTKTQHLEGKVTRLPYTNPRDRSTLEIFRNYQQALTKAGFQTLFTCASAECGDASNEPTDDLGYWCVTNKIQCPEPMRYIAAKLPRAEGDVYAAIKVRTEETYLVVVEIKAMEAGLVKTDVQMKSDITTTGHTPVYGIYFDTGKAEIKPESEPTLTEIVKLLDANPAMKLHVVGHTDNVGTLASNMTLSKQRADAVVAALTTKYRVAGPRLDAAGVGSLSPVATNRTDDGRAKNRRVELVEQ